MYAILGMELFSHRMRFNYENQSVPYFDVPRDDVSPVYSVPNSNFDTIANATLTVFIVLSNEGWTSIYFDHWRSVGPLYSSIYFVSLIVVG